jgi:hypothetical protein
MAALFDQDTFLSDDFSQNMLKDVNAYKADKNPAVFPPIFFNHVTND